VFTTTACRRTDTSPGTLNEAITLITSLYDRIDALEVEKKTVTEPFETQLKAAHEKIAELTAKAKRFERTDHELTEHRREQ